MKASEEGCIVSSIVNMFSNHMTGSIVPTHQGQYRYKADQHLSTHQLVLKLESFRNIGFFFKVENEGKEGLFFP